MRLVVGLGNPGKRYTKTRHNIGFVVVDALQEFYSQYGGSNWKLEKKFNAEISEYTVNSQKVILCKPMTYMNASGEAVQMIASYYKIKPQDIIVVQDEKDISFGEVKIQQDRGPAGHNGIKSIINQLGTQDFGRIRIGVGSTSKKAQDAATFVLAKFTLLERAKLKEVIIRVVQEIDNLIKN